MKDYSVPALFASYLSTALLGSASAKFESFRTGDGAVDPFDSPGDDYPIPCNDMPYCR